MLHFAICDDEALVRRKISDYIGRLEQELEQPIRVTEYASGMELLEQYPNDVDILFLDIKMQMLNGVQTAHRIREFSPEVCIIFITSMVQYALSCYKVHAFSFIQKPVQYGEFRCEVRAALRSMRRRTDHILLLADSCGATQYPVSSREIVYVEVRDHEVTVHLDNGTLTTRQKLKTIEEKLLPHGFVRCHLSYLVNLRQIQTVEAMQVRMSNGDLVPISKQRKKAFLTALADYAGGTL